MKSRRRTNGCAIRWMAASVVVALAVAWSNSTAAKAPPRGAWTLEVEPGWISAGTKDMDDLYGQGLTGGIGAGLVGAFDVAAGYVWSPFFQTAVVYGALAKSFIVEDTLGGVTESWSVPVSKWELRARFTLPSSGKLCWGVGGGFGTYTLSGATYRATGNASGHLDLTGSNGGGWIEAGPEWRWDRFALGVTAGYRFLTLEPVGYDGSIMGFRMRGKRLPTLTGRRAHFDYSGVELGIACRWYLGGYVSPATTGGAGSGAIPDPAGHGP